MIFGYGSRVDFVDGSGNEWRPATEIIVRTGHLSDAVAMTVGQSRSCVHRRVVARADKDRTRINTEFTTRDFLFR